MKNKKTYIFICITIANVGGAQLYMRNKLNYMQSKGWDIKVFSFDKSPIYIQELKKYKDGVIEGLKFPPYFFTKGQINKIVDRMAAMIEPSEEVVVECHAIMLSAWAELLAERLNGRHILYSLDEKPRVYPFIRDYMDFKLSRDEFASITANTVQLAYPQIQTIEEAEKHHLQAFCNNALEDVDDSYIDIRFEDGVRIGIFGRINKDYVQPMTKDLVNYINKNTNTFFNVVFIGGTPYPKQIDILKSMFAGVENAKLMFTGYLSPVPLNFMKKFDFFLASAGSAWATHNLNMLTVAIDGYNYKSNGVLGYQAKSAIDAAEKQYELSETLDDIIKENKYPKLPPKEVIIDYDYWFVPHIEKLSKASSNPKMYYGIDNYRLNKRYIVIRIFTKLLGPTLSSRIKDILYQK